MPLRRSEENRLASRSPRSPPHFRNRCRTGLPPHRPEKSYRRPRRRKSPPASRRAHAGKRMPARVGRVRECPLLDVKLTLLSHDLVRGAAGAALLNAELLAARGFLKRRSAVPEQNLAEPVTR